MLTMAYHLFSAVAITLHLLVYRNWAGFVLPPLGDRQYVQEGDLYIGGIFSMTAFDPVKPCGQFVDTFNAIETVETMAFMVNELNKRLPIQLGFVVIDTCSKESVAAVQALRFLPLSDTESDNTSATPEPLTFYDVIGVVGTDQSFTTKAVSRILNAANIPIISFWATDIALADKTLYPNFQRVIWSDEELIEAIVQFLLSNHFYYFTIMYENEYSLRKVFERILTEYGADRICHPEEVKVTDTDDIEDIIRHLMIDKLRPHVVVVLAHTKVSGMIADAVIRTQTEHKLLWVGGDAWMRALFHKGGPRGSVGLSFYRTRLVNLENYFRTLNASNKNPWFLEAAVTKFSCGELNRASCVNENMRNYQLFELGLLYVLKAVLVYGTALSDFFRAYCKNGSSKENLLICFKRNVEWFPNFLKDAPINWDLVPDLNVADDDINTNDGWRFSVYQSLGIPHDIHRIQDIVLNSHAPIQVNSLNTSFFSFDVNKLIATDYCMPVCRFGEYRFHISQCCWICKPCRANEIVSNAATSCKQCPILHWPSERSDGTGSCDFIEPHHLDNNIYLRIVFLSIAILGFMTKVGTLWWYSRNKENGIVKASSIELSCVQLLFLGCGYLSIPVFLTQPTDFSCSFGFLLYNLSFIVTYALVLFKAVRVYRIFTHYKKNLKVSYISPVFQITACFGFVLFEVLRFYIFNWINPVRSEVHQPDPLIPFTERACVVPNAIMFIFIIITFVVLLMCTVLAFKTQTLPNKFRESRYVSLCVVTTLLILSAFTPAYFTIVYREVRMLLLLAGVVINHSFTFFFLFVTRIIAVEQMKRARRQIAKATPYQRFHRTSKLGPDGNAMETALD
ncbi:metabotropic glutamate receptor-like [Biomphalaria glabrata]|uniref:Metabotropic glutamate receptor-like n=1 Tax=Biomphalaria glabrata TaxID=6526 RepID=A0A9W3A2H6_BIOGL|nr:metabotropic glutamate receptor-like [Biomphalaria glabrata]